MKYIRKLARFQISYTEDVLNSSEKEIDNIFPSQYFFMSDSYCL